MNGTGQAASTTHSQGCGKDVLCEKHSSLNAKSSSEMGFSFLHKNSEQRDQHRIMRPVGTSWVFGFRHLSSTSTTCRHTVSLRFSANGAPAMQPSPQSRYVAKSRQTKAHIVRRSSGQESGVKKCTDALQAFSLSR